jgi:hypothetical protein
MRGAAGAALLADDTITGLSQLGGSRLRTG